MTNKQRKTVLGLVFLTAFLDLVGFSILFPLFPHMLEHYLELEGDDSLIGRLVAKLTEYAGEGDDRSVLVTALFGGVLGSIYSILQFLFAPFWGALSDRIGRRPTLLLTLGGTALSYVVWFFAGNFALLIAARLIGGIMAGNISTATAVVADVTEPENRAKGMGMVGAAIGLGFIFGPAIGGLSAGWNLLDTWEGGAAYGVNPFSISAACALLIALINFLGVWRKFPETLPAKTGAGEVEVDRPKRSLNPLELFAGRGTPGLSLTNGIYFLFLLAFSAIEFTLTFLTLERFAYTPGQNAKMFVFVGLLIVLIQGGAIRRMAPRFGERRLSSFGVFAVIPGFWLIANTGTVGNLYLGLAFMAIGSASAMPCLGGLASRYAPAESQGFALGSFRSAGALARAVGPILGGAMYWQLGSSSAYLAAAAFLAVPLLMSFRLPAPPAGPATH